MKKRKGMMTIELLIIVGIIALGLSGLFVLNNKINTNIRFIKFAQELKEVVLAIDLQEYKFDGYPMVETPAKLVDTSIYHKKMAILKNITGKRWNYKTISLTNPDTLGRTSGSILIKIHNGEYTYIAKNKILNVFNKLCLNSRKDFDIHKNLTIDKMVTPHDWCLLKTEVKLFTPSE